MSDPVRRLLILVLCLLALPGGSTLGEGASLPTLTMVLYRVDMPSFDPEPVQIALNDYVEPRLGVKVNIRYVNADEYSAAFNRFMLTRDMPDVFYIPNFSLAQMLYDGGCLMLLDDLLSHYGQGILAQIDEGMLNPCRIGGAQAVLPSLFSYANAYGFEYKAAIAERNGIDMSRVRTMEDLTEVFQTLKQCEPEIICAGNLHAFRSWDNLQNGLGVLMDCGRSPDLVNLYETEEYRRLCLLWHDWNEKGYVLDTLRYSAPTNYFVRSANVFGKFVVIAPALTWMDSADAGTRVEAIPFTDTFLCRDDHRRILWGMSATCAYPDRAMALLEMMYVDPVVANLLCYGVRDVHYRLVDEANGVADHLEGVSSETSTYGIFRNYTVGNEFLTYVWNGWPIDLWDQVKENNDGAVRSLAYGVDFDLSALSEEIALCQAIVEHYVPLLQAGVGDVDVVLDEFNRALDDAGIDRILAEKQRQLDAARVESGDVR